MKPRDLFLAGIQAYLVVPFQHRGFKFRRSKLDFTRLTPAGVRQQISFQLSRWNAENDCEFWSQWAAFTPAYTDWFLREWDQPPDSDVLGGLADWNIPGWSRPPAEHFQLHGGPADEMEWRTFLENAETSGFPFLDRISTWQGAADQLRAERWHFDRAADFLLIAGEPQRARDTLLEGINTFEQMGRVDNFKELPRLKQRLQRYFASMPGAT